MLSKFLDPKNDFAFKKVFGTEKNKDILIHFLNDMITFKTKRPIEDVTFLKPVQDPETIASKTSIVDILCKDSEGSLYIVEMQVAKVKGFEKRAQYYASKAYISQARAGGEYQHLKEIVFLAIADFIMFPEKKAYKSDHVILDKESHENDLKDFSFTFLELPKFTKDIAHLSNMIEKWAYFFKHAEETSEDELVKLISQDPIIEKAYKELNRFTWNETELLTYDQAEKHEWDYKASMEQKFDEGKVEGRAEGEKAGLKKGEKIGVKKGRAEGERAAALKIAEALLQQGLPLKDIEAATGLSQEEFSS